MCKCVCLREYKVRVIVELTGILWDHMGRVESEVDEEGDGHSELEPLHHVGLPVERVGHVTSQNHGVPSTGSHKLGLFSDSVGTCSTKYKGVKGGILHIANYDTHSVCIQQFITTLLHSHAPLCKY